MITSKRIIQLVEEWFRDVKNGNISASVYVNPGSSDIRELYKRAELANRAGFPAIRFIADSRSPQKVYVWDAYYAYHDDVSKVLGFSRPNEHLDEPPFVYDGYGKIVSGKLVGNDTYATTLNIDKLLDSLESNNGRHFSDKQIKDRIDILRTIFSCNWMFIDRYIPGFSKIIEKRKQKFVKIEKYYSTLKSGNFI
jgi:hypothetical protein